MSAVAVARPIAEPIADRLAATAIPITTTVAGPTTEPVADGLHATARRSAAWPPSPDRSSNQPPTASAHPNATPVCSSPRRIRLIGTRRTTVPAAGPIRRSTTATIACPIIEPAAERIVVRAAVTTTVAQPITERIIPVGRAVVAVRVDNSGVAPVDDPVGCEIGQLLVDVAEQVEGLVVEQLGGAARGPVRAQQTVGVVEVVEGGIDQLALVVGDVHDGARSW